MPIITQKFLQDLGINLDEQTYVAFADHFDQTLSQRIIEGITDTLDDQELEELVAMQNQDDEQLQVWLQTKVPDLKDIIEDEVKILVGEIAENSDQIA